MENTPSEGSSGSFNEATYEKIVRDVFILTPYSESHPNDLSGSIHPIFSRRNWHIHATISHHDPDREEFFNVIDPVLRLASNLLQSPNSRLFLSYVFYADREHLVDLSNQLGRNACQFTRIEGIDFSELLGRTTTLLNRLAGQIDFQWYDPSNLSNDDERGDPFMLGFCKRRSRIPAYMSRSGRPTGHVSRISMNLDMFFTLRRLRSHLHNNSSGDVEGVQSQILRLQFSMATALCHEIVHACNVSIAYGVGLTEPFFEDERVAELGHSWESFVIGGILSNRTNAATSNRGDEIAANAMVLCKWPGFKRGTHVSLERSLPLLYQNKFYIPMDWIARIQQDVEWQSTNPDDITALLVIPRTLGFTEQYEGDDFDPDWESKWVNELEYVRPEGPNLETTNLETKESSAADRYAIDPQSKEIYPS